MQLTQRQELQLKDLFEGADKQRLLYGPGEPEALYLHGFMLGIRETLESQGVSLPGVTGLWWYEELETVDGEIPGRQKSTQELLSKYGEKDESIARVVDGSKKAASEVMFILAQK